MWVKPSIGPGYYWRQRHELLLLAVRGTPGTTPKGVTLDSVISAPRGKHSVKPEALYSHLEQMYPRARRAELFARRPRAGWAAWGNEAPGAGDVLV